MATTGSQAPEIAGEGAAAPNARRRTPLRSRMAPRNFKSLLIQALVLTAALGFLTFISFNVLENVRRLGIETGFLFLSMPAGFDIAQKLIPYTAQSTYFAAFLVALLNTVLITVVCIVISTVIGFFVGLGRLSRNPLLAGISAAYVEIIRNVPLLLQLLFWYFVIVRPLPSPRNGFSFLGLAFLSNRGLFLPVPESGFTAFAVVVAIGLAMSLALMWLAARHRMNTGRVSGLRWLAPLPLVLVPVVASFGGFLDLSWSVPELRGFNYAGGLNVIPEFVAMAAGLSVYSAAFIAEIFRGGFKSVPKGQSEAGLSLGLPGWLVTWKVTVPLALRAIVPPLGAQYVLLLKNSSLAAAIAYPDLMLIFAGTALNQTGQPLEVMFITLSAYLMLGLAIATATNLWNRRLALVER